MKLNISLNTSYICFVIRRNLFMNDDLKVIPYILFGCTLILFNLTLKLKLLLGNLWKVFST
jgi:hypothetical protein